MAAVALAVTLPGCRNKTTGSSPAAPAASLAPSAVPTATPAPTRSNRPISAATPAATPCGSDKLFDYLNLLPTSTAKEEIAKTLGHNRVRYIGLEEAKASASPQSTRVTAGLGPDGRIKEFSCG